MKMGKQKRKDFWFVFVSQGEKKVIGNWKQEGNEQEKQKERERKEKGKLMLGKVRKGEVERIGQ